MPRFPLLLVMALLAFSALPPPQPALAADFRVTTEADTDDGECDRHCSLREAIIDANHAGGGTVRLPAGVYQLSIEGQGEDASATGDLDITSDVTIVGRGERTVIDGGGLDRVLDIHSGAVQVRRVTIEGGYLDGERSTTSTPDPIGAGIKTHAPAELRLRQSVVRDNRVGEYGGGGGVLNYGEATIVDSLITSNQVPGDAAGWGGGIANYGTATLLRSRVVENRGEDGGGIYNAGSLEVVESRIDENVAQDNGWGLFQARGGVAFIEGTTFRGNEGFSDGAIFNRGQMEISRSLLDGGGFDTVYPLVVNGFESDLAVVNSTITNHQAIAFLVVGTDVTLTIVGSTITESAGFAEVDGSPVITVAGSIVEGGCWIVPESTPDIRSLGHNILADDGTCTEPHATDLVDADPMLEPLADHGGPTLTHVPSHDSPAIDAAGNLGLGVDQRGVERPQGDAFDIGAVEVKVEVEAEVIE